MKDYFRFFHRGISRPLSCRSRAQLDWCIGFNILIGVFKNWLLWSVELCTLCTWCWRFMDIAVHIFRACGRYFATRSTKWRSQNLDAVWQTDLNTVIASFWWSGFTNPEIVCNVQEISANHVHTPCIMYIVLWHSWTVINSNSDGVILINDISWCNPNIMFLVIFV